MNNYKQQREIIDKIREYYYSDFKDYELRASGVYGIKNKITGQIYIGSTGVTFKQRWSQHVYDLVTLNHSNGFLLDSWTSHNYKDFEFVVLEKAGETDSRNDLYTKEEKHIRNCIDNDIKLFNIALNENISKLRIEYKTRQGEIKTYYLKDMIKEQFKELLVNTFYDSMLNELIIEEILEEPLINADNVVMYIDGVTEGEYAGIQCFLDEAHRTKLDKVKWELDDFDMCECSVIGCTHYDSQRHYCRRYDEYMSEVWYKPTWCYQFQDEYIVDLEKYDEQGFPRK